MVSRYITYICEIAKKINKGYPNKNNSIACLYVLLQVRVQCLECSELI